VENYEELCELQGVLGEITYENWRKTEIYREI